MKQNNLILIQLIALPVLGAIVGIIVYRANYYPARPIKDSTTSIACNLTLTADTPQIRLVEDTHKWQTIDVDTSFLKNNQIGLILRRTKSRNISQLFDLTCRQLAAILDSINDVDYHVSKHDTIPKRKAKPCLRIIQDTTSIDSLPSLKDKWLTPEIKYLIFRGFPVIHKFKDVIDSIEWIVMIDTSNHLIMDTTIKVLVKWWHGEDYWINGRWFQTLDSARGTILGMYNIEYQGKMSYRNVTQVHWYFIKRYNNQSILANYER